MAGGAGTYTVGDVGYASIAAAMTQLVSDEDGTPFTAAQNIVLTQDSTESVAITLPKIGDAYGVSKYPLIIRGDQLSPRRKWIRTAANGAFINLIAADLDVTGATEFRDLEFNYNAVGTAASFLLPYYNGQNLTHLYRRCEWTSTSGMLGYVINGRYGYNADFVDCVIRASVFRAGSSTIWGDYLLSGCKAHFSGAVPLVSGGTVNSYVVRAVNSALRLNGSIANNTSQGLHVGLDFRHCTILFDTASYFTTIGTSTANDRQVGWPMIRNCILHNAKGLRQDTANISDIRILNPLASRDNIWSALAAGNSFVDYPTASFDVATLADVQAFGLEDGSVTHAGVTFVSTAVTSADFLKVASLPNTSRNCGVYTDAFGTDRSAYLVAPGHYQETPRTLDLTTTSGGGNYNIANLTTDKVVKPIAFGLSQIGISAVAPANDVRNTVETGTTTGNLIVPSANDLRDGVGVGTNGTEVIGNLFVPSADNLRDGTGAGTNGDEVVGNLRITTSNNVRLGIGIGSNGTEVVGDIVVPSEHDLRDGVGAGSEGTEVNGDILLPDEDKVVSGTHYDSYGSRTGSAPSVISQQAQPKRKA